MHLCCAAVSNGQTNHTGGPSNGWISPVLPETGVIDSYAFMPALEADAVAFGMMAPVTRTAG